MNIQMIIHSTEYTQHYTHTSHFKLQNLPKKTMAHFNRMCVRNIRYIGLKSENGETMLLYCYVRLIYSDDPMNVNYAVAYSKRTSVSGQHLLFKSSLNSNYATMHVARALHFSVISS